MASVQYPIMEEQGEVHTSGRVLVEPVEFVDLRDIARGKHGSHRSSPEREPGAKRTPKAISPARDCSTNCLQIAPQPRARRMEAGYVCSEASQRPETGTRAPSKDEVLSVVIQKLTELVKNSEKQKRDGPDTDDDQAQDSRSSGELLGDDRTKLYQCPQCPCLFAVKQKHSKGQLCLCCRRDSHSNSSEESSDVPQQSEEARCYREGQDHGGISCDLCSIVVQSYNDLLYHLATHDVNIFRCKFCQYVTTRHTAIEDHQVVHMGEDTKRCVCNVCGFRTSELSKLQHHYKKAHQTVKGILLKCSECGYSTRKESALRNHMWSHIESDSAVQSHGKLTSDDQKRQKIPSPSQSDTEEASTNVKGAASRRGSKRSALSPDSVDENTKLFKCLLCGYLCEKLSTLKAHAWRHAGQEGCSYPVMHKVEDVSQLTSSEGEDCSASVVLKATDLNFVEVTGSRLGGEKEKKPSRKESGCHCFPILLPDEEHQIVQQVFAGASAVPPDDSGNSSTVTTSGTDDPHTSTPSTAAHVTKNVPDQTEESTLLGHTETCQRMGEVDASFIADSIETVCSSTLPEAFPLGVDCEEIIVEEVVMTDAMTVEKVTVEENASVSTTKECLGSEGKVDGEERSCNNLKRRRSSSELESEKRLCTQPGISKMLLSAVDDALQTRGETLNTETRISADVENNMKVITASSNLPSENYYQCPICKQLFPSDVQTHVCSQGSTPIFKCHKCPATFWHLGRLQTHMGTHEAILKCGKCPFSCSSEMALRDHVKKAHLPAKSSICPSCHNDVVEKSPKAHEESCVLKCLYGCRECDFTAGTIEELKAHCNATHLKPYKCSVCDYSSATPNGIKNHMKFHNTDKPYKCHLCDFSGAYPQSLRSHMKKHAAGAPGQSSDTYKCKFCKYYSGHLPSMKSHMWKHSSHPGYDYDGQDIFKMVVKCSATSEDLSKDDTTSEHVAKETLPKTICEEQVCAPPVEQPVITKISQSKSSKASSYGTAIDAISSQNSGALSTTGGKIANVPIKLPAAITSKGHIEKTGPQKQYTNISHQEPAVDKTMGRLSSDAVPHSRQIQYGSVIFQCSQCGFKSNDHSCLVEHLKDHLKDTLQAPNAKV